MIVIPEIKTVVLQPPRTASTSIKTALLAAYPQATNPHRHMERVGIPKEFCDYDVVGIIRHPMDRLWSLYKYMRWHPGKPEGEPYRRPDLASMWIERVSKDADRPFQDWLFNSTDPFADMHDDGTCTSEYFSTAHPSPATRKSQFEYLRPDMGPIEILRLEDGNIGKRFGVELPQLNKSKELRRTIPSTLAVLSFIGEHHSWDLEQYHG